MTEAMPFLQKYDITFLRPPTNSRRAFYMLSFYLTSLLYAAFCASRGKTTLLSIMARQI